MNTIKPLTLAISSLVVGTIGVAYAVLSADSRIGYLPILVPAAVGAILVFGWQVRRFQQDLQKTLSAAQDTRDQVDSLAESNVRAQLPSSKIAEQAQEIGLTSIKDGGIEIDNITENISNASQLIRMSTVSGLRVIWHYADILAEALARGVSIQIIMPDTNNVFVKDVAIMVGRKNLNDEADDTISALREINSKARNKNSDYAGRLSFARFDSVNKVPIIICDSKYAFFKVVLPPQRSSQAVSFEVSKGPILDALTDHFEELWKILTADNQVEDIS